MRVHLTQRYADALRPGVVQRIWDTGDGSEGGLLLEVGKLGVRWAVQFDRRKDESGNALVPPQTIKVRIGPREKFSVKDARVEAANIKKLVQKGQNPNKPPKPKADPNLTTVRQAFGDKLAALRADGCSQKTVNAYDYALEALAEVADRPLAEVANNRKELRELRNKLALQAPGRADNAMKYLSATYSRADPAKAQARHLRTQADDEVAARPSERSRPLAQGQSQERIELTLG